MAYSPFSIVVVDASSNFPHLLRYSSAKSRTNASPPGRRPAATDQPFQLSRARNLKLAAPVRLRTPHQLPHPRLGIERLAPPTDFEPTPSGARAIVDTAAVVRPRRPRLLLRRSTTMGREMVTGRFPHAERLGEVTEVDRLEVEQVLLGRRVGCVRSDVRLEGLAREGRRLASEREEVSRRAVLARAGSGKKKRTSSEPLTHLSNPICTSVALVSYSLPSPPYPSLKTCSTPTSRNLTTFLPPSSLALMPSSRYEGYSDSFGRTNE